MHLVVRINPEAQVRKLSNVSRVLQVLLLCASGLEGEKGKSAQLVSQTIMCASTEPSTASPQTLNNSQGFRSSSPPFTSSRKKEDWTLFMPPVKVNGR